MESNIYLIPTDKFSKLQLKRDGGLHLEDGQSIALKSFLNIYITNSEKPKARDWVLGDFPDNPIGKVISKYGQEFTAQSLNGDKYGLAEYDSKKIILTTDPDLIKEGIQSINDEFLQWFVENPSCEKVEVSYGLLKPFQSNYVGYIIHLPDTTDVLEDPKQETLEEAAEIYWKMQYIMALDESTKPYIIQDFTAGAKWQQEQDKNKYSEEEVDRILRNFRTEFLPFGQVNDFTLNNWFSQFKKQNNEQ